MNEKKNGLERDGRASPSVRLSVYPSIFKMMEEVKTRLEYQGDPQADEICLIIAEVLMMNPRQAVKVGGSIMDAYILQEVFEKLTHDHVALVMDNFKKVTAKIHNKKSYLRTALYNSVFELDSHYINEVKHDFGL